MGNAASGEQALRHLSLGDVAEITMGQSPASGSLNTNEEGVPFLQGCAEFGSKSPLTNIYCNPALRLSKPESILISVRAPVGTLNWGDQSYCIGRGLAAIRATENTETGFLFYAIAQNVNFLHRRSQGSTFLAIGGNDLKIFPVPDFDVNSQQKIARILQTIDWAIEQTEALIEKYQQIKAGLMHDLFTRGIGPDGQLRPPREQAPYLYQQTPIGWIPKEWEVEKVCNALESIVDGPFGSNLKTEHYIPDPGVRVVRLQNVAEYEYNDNDKAYISEKHAKTLIRNNVIGNDVLVAGLGEERYPVGRACVYPKNLPPAINKADCFRARCNPSATRNEYFMLFLNSEHARKQIQRYEQGVTRPRINIGNLKKVLVLLPSFEEQSQIIGRYEAIQKRVSVEINNLGKLQKQKSGLMHDLLTGKVPVTPDPEPAHG